MRKLVVVVAVAALAALVATSMANAQEVTLEDVEAAFIDLTRAEFEAMGYFGGGLCISAETVGEPAELGGHGTHAINAPLIDTTLDPLEPEAILLDLEDNVIGLQYLTPPQEEPLTVLGQQLTYVEIADWDSLHVWFLENPSGQFADFNPNFSCPAGTEAPEVMAAPATGTGGYTRSNSSGVLIVLTLLGLAGSALAAAGWTLRRSTGR